MKLTTVLFDLDGTLLPMDQDVFLKAYFSKLAAKLAPHGYDPKKLIDGIWAGTTAMVKNDGSKRNEDAFWETFSSIFGPHAVDDAPVFEEYYRVEFQQVKDVCGYDPKAVEAIQIIKAMGLRTALATNPLFPAIATESRIRWAGLDPEDFELYTTYEDSKYCKPNPAYYQEILQKLSLRPEECLMVGNDVGEDMIAETLGMKVFLIPACMINKAGKDISAFPQGNFEDLVAYIETLLA